MPEIDTDTVLAKIRAALTFGKPVCDGFSTNSNSPAEGGWINTSIPVEVEGRVIGTAEIGNWVYTGSEGSNITADIYDEVRRSGYACRYYEGFDRNFQPSSDSSWQELFALNDLEVDEVSGDQIEQAILDAAEQEDTTEYEEVFADALRDRLSDTVRDGTNDLINAVRALEGN